MEDYYYSLVKLQVPVVNAVTKIFLLSNQAVLLQVNEAALMRDGHSLLSKNQAEHYGIKIDDDPYFGNMKIKVEDQVGEPIELHYKDGLTYFQILLLLNVISKDYLLSLSLVTSHGYPRCWI